MSTLVRWLASISVAHIRGNFDNPTRLKIVKDTLYRIRARYGIRKRRVAPILTDDIKAIIDRLDHSVADTRNKALILTMFHGSMRSAEVISLTTEDFYFNLHEEAITFRRKEGDSIACNRGITLMSDTDVRYCPVSAMEQWLNVSGIKEGSVFRAVNRPGGVGSQALTIQGLAKIVKSLAHRANLDASNLSSHSLRSGLITSALYNGEPICKITYVADVSSYASIASYINHKMVEVY